MSEGVYTYIDGESHYVRLEKAWQKLHGKDACLSQLRYSDDPNGDLILYIPNANVFWTKKWNPGQRIFYFTAMSGNDAEFHEVRKRIREFGVDPQLVEERRILADQRRTRLEQGAVIEKAKGVDCSIFVRMLTDAQSDLYQLCNLFTSDVDYIPVITAVMSMGKRVVVHGFKDGLGEYSAMEHVPNQFVDLEEMLTNEFKCVPKT